MYLRFSVLADRNFRYFGDVGTECDGNRDFAATSIDRCRARPFRHLRYGAQHSRKARRFSHEREAPLDGILSNRLEQLVDEALDCVNRVIVRDRP